MPAPGRSNTLSLDSTFQPPQTTGFDGFSFKDLQNVQFVEEKANEIRLVLRSNSDVLGDMLNEYRMMIANASCANVLPADFETALTRFGQRIEIIRKDMALQIARVDTLLSVSAGRKSLVSSRLCVQERQSLTASQVNAVFQFRSMQASKEYAEKAHQSGINMEKMTQKMSVIAEKTEAETVSMRIITCVMLFFLPGTFMAVSIHPCCRSGTTAHMPQALFSTPIINYQKASEDGGWSMSHIGSGALALYVFASVPLVFATFAAWWIMDIIAKRKRKRRELEAMDAENGIINFTETEKESPVIGST